MKLDIIAFAAHPDDVELSCSGTLLKLAAQGKKTGIIDLTRGELGSRGTPAVRVREAEKAGKILGLSARENLEFRDGFFLNDEAHQLRVVQAIRKYQPEIVLANATEDRHNDHGRGSRLVREAAFLSGLKMIRTLDENGKQQAHWRPKRLFFYIQDHLMIPDFVVDITPYFESKIFSIKAFESQFYDPDSTEPATYISSPDFLDFIEARAREMGHLIGATFGEGFVSETPLKVDDLAALI